MSVAQERLRILKMIEAGTLAVSDGAALLAAMDGGPQSEIVEPGSRARWMRIRISDATTGDSKVSVDLPLGLAGVGARLGASFLPATANLRVEDLLRAVKAGSYGKVADVQDAEANERVEVFIE